MVELSPLRDVDEFTIPRAVLLSIISTVVISAIVTARQPVQPNFGDHATELSLACRRFTARAACMSSLIIIARAQGRSTHTKLKQQNKHKTQSMLPVSDMNRLFWDHHLLFRLQ
jgi:hypothetical protein